MSQGLISKKYLIDIANAIRAKLGTETAYTPEQMANAIASISGGSGEIVKSTNTDKGLITDSIMTDICDALREKLGVQTTYTPSQIADAILTITPSLEIVPWSTGTDEQIVSMIQAAHDGTIDLQTDGEWAVGDVRTISVGSFTDGAGTTHSAQEIDIVISSFDEYMSCGNVMQFDFKNGLASSIRMNLSATNVGGYGQSEMKTTTLPALVNALPAWLKNNLLEFSVLVSAGNKSSTIETITGNKLAFRSEIEICNNVNYSAAGEGNHISYYISNVEAKKKRGSLNTYYPYWLRSPKKNDAYSYCIINDKGYSSYTNADWSSGGVAPFGCL